MNISKRLLGAVSGLILGAIVTTTLAYIAMTLFYKGGGFVIDFAPLAILISSIMWGGFSGAIVGFSMLPRLKSLLAGLILALLSLASLFFSNAAEKGLGDAADLWRFFFSVGIFCFLVITTFSGFVIGAFNQAVINPQKAKDQTKPE